MSRIIQKNQPCLNHNCSSSDARQVYEEGTSFCFSCRSWFPPEGKGGSKVVVTKEMEDMVHLEDILKFDIRGNKLRKVNKKVAEFFEMRCSYDSEGNIDAYYYPYGVKEITGYKERKLPKTFHVIGKQKGLFGQLKFNGGKRLVITEGEEDALAVAQAYYDRYEKVYPVVSLPSASAANVLLEQRDWVRNFDEVILMLDNDKAGETALPEIAKIVGYDKVKIAKLPEKDASDVLVKYESKLILQAIYDATPFKPAGILSTEDLWTALAEYNEKESVLYPVCLEGLNSKLRGMRTGEITLFTSGTGSGKSTMLREIVLHLIKNTKSKVGIISLEESPAETARKLSGMALDKNPSNEEIPLDELRIGFDSVFGENRILVLDHQGSIQDSSIISQLEYMCLAGCKYIFIDHITILVSEGAEGLTGNEAIDKIMNDLLRLVKSHDVWIGLVSHLRKSDKGKNFEEGKLPSLDDIKGSGSIKQISFDIVGFARNLLAESEIDRNTIKMRVLKSRYTGLTGSVPGTQYNHTTGRLVGLTEIPKDENEYAI
jgi:twinkle protein